MTRVTVVVGTLDLYKDAWSVMCYSLKTYWPDCPWSVQFITNSLEAPCGKTIKVGGDHTEWSKRMRRGLAQVETPIILWLTEDNWLTGPVDTNALKDFVGHVLVKGVHHIRLYPGWNHDRSKGPFKYDPRLLVFERKTPYRTSLKPALWKTQTFLELLKDGESPWDFELLGSKRSRKYGDAFLAIEEWGIFPFVTPDPSGVWSKSPVVKGKWTTAAKLYCEKEGLEINLRKHPVSRDVFDGRPPPYILP